MKKNHANCHGSVKPCLINPTFKHSNNKSPTSISNNKQILNYFLKKGIGSSENKEKPENFDSPYKNILSEPTPILNDSLQDENDFKNSKPFLNVKLETLKSNIDKPQNKRRKCRKSTLKNGIQKKLTNMIKDNLSFTDTNPEHLQMALALSKSEQSEENIENNFEINYSLTQTKTLNARKTLEKFGFKSQKQIRKTTEVIKKPKKSRYQYVTPTLYLRTEEDRQKLISHKISIILSQNSPPPYYDKTLPEVKSQYLSDLVCKSAHLFNFNNINHEQLDTDIFYVEDLKLEKSNTKCGHLLKDWSKIPGREKTPERNFNDSNLKSSIISNVPTEKQNINVNILKNSEEVVVLPNITSKEENQEKMSEISSINRKENTWNAPQNALLPRTVSPDLFASDEEDTYEINKTIEKKLQSSLEMISNMKRFSLSQTISEQKIAIIDMPSSIVDNENMECERNIKNLIAKNAISNMYFANIPKDDSNKNCEYSNLEKDDEVHDEISSSEEVIKNDKDNYTEINVEEYNTTNHSAEEVMKNTKDDYTEINVHKYNTTNHNINTNEVMSAGMNVSFNKTTESQNKILETNPTEDCIINNYQIELNNTDDMLTTLEITLTENILHTTPNNKNINASSASLLSNFESFDRSNKRQTYEVSSDNSDCNITCENINGIQHFESFYDELDKLDEKNSDERSNSYIFNSDKISDKSKEDILSYNNKSLIGIDSINYAFDQNSCLASKVTLGNVPINNYLEQSEIDPENKYVTRKNIEIETTKNRFEDRKMTYEILSDSDSTCIYEFQNDDKWQKIYKNSSISELLEKSIINHENLQPSISKIASRDKESVLRKSVSFTPLQSNNYDLELSRTFKKHASFSTPSPRKSISFKNKSMEELKKYPSYSSVSSENNIEDGVICISDEELNYSSMHSTPYDKCKNNRKNMNTKLSTSNSDEENIADRSINVLNEDEKNNVSSYSYLEKYYDDFLYNTNENQTEFHENSIADTQSPLAHPRVLELSNKKLSTFKSLCENKNEFLRKNETTPTSEKVNNATTPDGHVIIKTNNITPMPNYDNMNTPAIHKELQKMGVKQLKRHRGVQILKHIYETTHPILDNHKISEDEDEKHTIKRRKVFECKSRRRLEIGASSNNTGSVERNAKSNICENLNIEIVGDISESEDLIFERKQSKKISGCPLPLHIAFHNLISSNQQLKQNILLYEPIQLEGLYAMLKEQGYKYHIQDLLTFLDKKCITVRTGQNLGQRRRY